MFTGYDKRWKFPFEGGMMVLVTFVALLAMAAVS
jgi:hypothetical protein